MQDADGKTFFDEDSSLSSIAEWTWATCASSPCSRSRSRLGAPACPAERAGQVWHLDQRHGQRNKVAYVPLQVITEDKGEERWRWRAHAVPARRDLGNAQQFRLVWLVQALVDVCAESKDGQCTTYSEYNVPQVDSFVLRRLYLTGLSVREEHGTGHLDGL